MELQGTHTRGMLVVDKRVWFPIESKNVEIVEFWIVVDSGIAHFGRRGLKITSA